MSTIHALSVCPLILIAKDWMITLNFTILSFLSFISFKCVLLALSSALIQEYTTFLTILCYRKILICVFLFLFQIFIKSKLMNVGRLWFRSSFLFNSRFVRILKHIIEFVLQNPMIWWSPIWWYLSYRVKFKAWKSSWPNFRFNSIWHQQKLPILHQSISQSGWNSLTRLFLDYNP